MLPEDFFYLKFPDEETAECGNCPQVLRHDYKEPYKCCTYIPRIPNFLIGAALEFSPNTEQIKAGLSVFGLPEGSLITPAFYETSLLEAAKGNFGKSEKIRCPFLEKSKGLCGIYPFRNSVCSTFFCWNDHGTRGHMFWEKIQGLVGQIETAIAHWCMDELGLPIETYIERFDQVAQDIEHLSCPTNHGWSPDIRKKLFGQWAGKEREFFHECFKLVYKNKDRLFDIAKSQPLYDTWQYNRALYEWFSTEAKKEIEIPPPKKAGQIVSISDLWYELQLFHRDLWKIPFNESAYKLNPKVIIQENNRDDKIAAFYKGKPFHLKFLKDTSKEEIEWDIFIDQRESDFAKLFETPKSIDASILESKEASHLKDCRATISHWLRLKVLISDDH